MLKKSSMDAYIIPIGISSIASSIVGELNANKEFDKKYNIEKMPIQDKVKFYDALNRRLGLKRDIAWGTGKVLAQGVGIIGGGAIAGELSDHFYPGTLNDPAVLSTGAALGVAPMSYISSKMYAKALGENAIKSIKPNTEEYRMKQGSWMEGYAKEELEKIAGPLGYTTGSLIFSPIGAGVGVPAAIGVNKGIDEAIISTGADKEEQQLMKSKPGFWTGTKAGITSIVPTLAGTLAGYGIGDAISDDHDAGLYGGLVGGAAAGIPSSYYLGKYFGKDDALTARAMTHSTVKVKQGSWMEGYAKEELEKIAACAKREKDAVNTFDLDNGNNNITSSKYITTEQSQNISKILPKFQRKGGVLPSPLTPKPALTNLARRA